MKQPVGPDGGGQPGRSDGGKPGAENAQPSGKIDQYLQLYHHRKLSAEQQLKLEEPISALEVEGVIGQLARDKTCGLDQFPLELYYRLLHLIVLVL
ncbi:hypothetical protein NDU88_004130 [Pleurodeles waltl]|uniref:Uncharacterized protein n=1 Tax=Pleurodeles waltl TaxID=8319 RepID=A0AAV7M6P3_PLEWA|nr:hypothetical protein NDU88_004130 [Pleurodeles waltl]